MDIVHLLRKCVHREREVIATFEHPSIMPGWRSPEGLAPRERWMVVCGTTVNGEAGHWTPFELWVGDGMHGRITPYTLTAIPPRQTYSLLLPAGQYGSALTAGFVQLLGWTLTDSALASAGEQ